MNQSGEKTFQTRPSGAVLLVDEDLEQQEFVRGVVEGIGCTVQACNSYIEGMCQLASGAFDIIVVGQGSHNFEGRCVLEAASEYNRQLPVVVVARHLEMGCYLEAMQLGAVDYLAGPFVSGEIARVMRNRVARRKGNVEPGRLPSTPISERPVA